MKKLGIGALLVSALYGVAGVAQERPMLEEVIVTAQKRAESLQDTPISISAFGEERLEIDGIGGLNDLASKVPSMTIEPFPTSAATLRIFIRGVGLPAVQVTQDPPVAIYLDGVYVARATGTAMELADLQRIEVLRGPQGTLYGRNSTGGAVNLVTRRPSTESIEFKQKFTIGNRNLFASRTNINIPLTNNVAAKLSLLRSELDGFVVNTGPGEDFGDRDVTGYRVDLRWQPTERLTLDYSWEKSDTDYVNYMYQAISPPDDNKAQAESVKRSTQAETLYSDSRLDKLNSGTPMEASRAVLEGHALVALMDFEIATLKYIYADRELSDAAYANFGGGAGSLTFRLDSHVDDSAAATAVYGGPTPLVTPEVTQNQFSHELQLSGDFLSARLSYIAGLYYFEEEAKDDRGPIHHIFTAPVDGTMSAISSIAFQNFVFDNRNEAAAVYLHAKWTPEWFDERLHLTFGARHSEDSRFARKFAEAGTYLVASAVAVPVGNNGVIFDNLEAERDFADDSFDFVAEFALRDDINVYLKRNEAYKSGGFNTTDPQHGATGDPATDDTDEPASDGQVWGFGFADGFDSEKLTSWELGIKSELLERQLRINADVFYSEYEDMQVNFLLTGTIQDTKVTNAGSAEMYGAEIDVTWLANENLLLALNYAYLEAEVTEAIDPQGNDRTDEFIFYSAPQHSYTLSMDWTVKRWDWGRLDVNVSHNFMDERAGIGEKAKVRIDGSDRRGAYIGDYRLTNLRIGFNDISVGGQGRLSVAAWTKNLMDLEYEITALYNLPQSDRMVWWGEPRTYGLDIIYNY